MNQFISLTGYKFELLMTDFKCTGDWLRAPEILQIRIDRLKRMRGTWLIIIQIIEVSHIV